MENVTTTVSNPRTIIEMFTDATTGESYAENRMITTENRAGNTVLLAYGHHVIGEYDESEEHVTVYLGHKGVSKTLTGYVNRLIEIATERREVTLSPEEPSIGRAPDCVEYIDHYIDFSDMSPVERDALDNVRRALRFANRFL